MDDEPELAQGGAVQPVGELLDRLEGRELRPPPRGDPRLTVVGARELPVDRRGRVGVVAEVRGERRPLPEAPAPGEGPERGLERADDVAGPRDLGRLPAEERAGRDLVDLGDERPLLPQAGTGEKRGASSSSFAAPASAPTISPARYRHESTAVAAPCVVLELSPASSTAVRGSAAWNMTAGASRISQPLPALRGSVDPE
jgi:hypothetical protein